MAKDIKLYKGEEEITINELQLDNFIALGWTEKKSNNKPNKDKNKWQHITEKKA
jgi:hypothetical protein